MSDLKRAKMSDSILPDDLVIDILLKLGQKSLLKFRCVSKSWHSIISSNYFIGTRIIDLRERERFMFMKSYYYEDHTGGGQAITEFNHGPLHSNISEGTGGSDEICAHVNCKYGLTWIAYSYGLVCLMDYKDLILWNPITKACKKLPEFENDMFYQGYGFGFDERGDDYKVFGYGWKLHLPDMVREKFVKIYSLKTGQWRRINSPVAEFDQNGSAFPVFANMKFHWIERVGWRDSHAWDSTPAWNIAYLDLETEEYGVLVAPDFVNGGLYWNLVVSEGCLYVLCVVLDYGEVWEVEGYGVGKKKTSWTKVAHIPFIDIPEKVCRKILFSVYKSTNDFVLRFTRKFTIFNAKDGSFRYPEVKNSDGFGAV